jgi:Family of unknown function (DUF5681)
MTLVEPEPLGDDTSGVHHTRPWLRAPWRPGQSGNPLGRPKGSRNKLAEQFFIDVYEHWKKSGPEALERVYRDDPSTYLRVVAQALPKEFVVKQESVDDLSDEELLDIIATLRHLTAETRAIESRKDISGEGTEERLRRESD